MSARAWPSNALEAAVGPPQQGTALPHGSLRSWETWITLGLVFLAFMAITSSIEQADWVAEMPSLTGASLLGLLAGFALAHVRWPSAALTPFALAFGAATTLLQTLYAMDLVNLAQGTGLEARWDELVLRIEEWVSAVVEGDVSTDPLPFILLVVFVSWLMSFLASWAVFRLRNGWLAVIPGGVALLTNISYLPGQPSLAFMVYLFAAILIVTRMHAVQAEARWREERTPRPPLLTLEVLNFATWVGLALIVAAWLVPTANHWGPVADGWERATAPLTDRFERLGRAFFGIDAKRVDMVHKFGEVLPLQGRIQLSSEPLLTAEAPPDVTYLRAAVYDEYTGRAWRMSASRTVPLPGTSVDAAAFGTPETRAEFRRPFVVTVSLESASAGRRLLAPGEPLAASIDATLLVGEDGADVLGIAPASRLRDGGVYEVVGTISGATSATLAASPPQYPMWVAQRYLQLPSDLPPEVVALARSLTADVDSPYLKARRIEQHLRTQYVFDLNAPDPPPRSDAVASFLFGSRRGYFDQYASAMVVLLRAADVPSRMAVGFALDPRDQDPTTRAYAVSDRAAWAWPEVYFAGLGWVDFNPTPTRPTVTRPQDDSEFADSDAIPTDEDFDPALGFLLDEAEVDPTGGMSGRPLQLGEDEGGLSRVASIVARVATGLVVLALFALAGLLALRLLWIYRFRGLAGAASRWARLLELANWAGVSPPSTSTPLEAAGEIRQRAGLDVSLEPLARAYTRERYGRPLEGVDSGAADVARRGPGPEALDADYVVARNRLLRLIARRLLPWRRRRRAAPPGLTVGRQT